MDHFDADPFVGKPASSSSTGFPSFSSDGILTQQLLEDTKPISSLELFGSSLSFLEARDFFRDGVGMLNADQTITFDDADEDLPAAEVIDRSNVEKPSDPNLEFSSQNPTSQGLAPFSNSQNSLTVGEEISIDTEFEKVDKKVDEWPTLKLEPSQNLVNSQPGQAVVLKLLLPNNTQYLLLPAMPAIGKSANLMKQETSCKSSQRVTTFTPPIRHIRGGSLVKGSSAVSIDHDMCNSSAAATLPRRPFLLSGSRKRACDVSAILESVAPSANPSCRPPTRLPPWMASPNEQLRYKMLRQRNNRAVKKCRQKTRERHQSEYAELLALRQENRELRYTNKLLIIALDKKYRSMESESANGPPALHEKLLEKAPEPLDEMWQFFTDRSGREMLKINATP